MEALSRFQRWMQRLAAKGIGQDTRFPRHTSGMMRVTGLEGDILRYPVDTERSTLIQNDQGQFFFVADVSQVDGPDLIQ